MADANFTNLPRHLAKADIDFDTSTFKTMLVSSVPSEANLDAWVFRSDVTNEVTGAGYTAGGVAQAFTLAALDTTNNRQDVTYTNLAPGWTGSSIAAVGAIIYQNTGAAGTDRLLHFVDFGGTVTSTANDFNVTYTAPFRITR